MNVALAMLCMFVAGMYARVAIEARREVLRLRALRAAAVPRRFVARQPWSCRPLELPTLEALVIQKNRDAGRAALHVAMLFLRRGDDDDRETARALLADIKDAYVACAAVVIELRGLATAGPRRAA